MKSLVSWVLGGIGIALAALLCMPAAEVRAQRVATSSAEARPDAQAAAATRAATGDEPGVNWEDARLLAEVMQRVREQYVQPVDSRTLMHRAAGSLVTGLDEYSALLDPGAYEDIKVATSGAYAGVGIEIETRDGGLGVARVIADSPAARAGLQAGDVLEAIDDIAVAENNLETATAALRGESGTPVRLGIRRGGQVLQVGLRRGRVELPSVQSVPLQPGIGYVRISSFTDATAAEFSTQLSALRRDPALPLDGLVIDLRNNPGGVLDAAVAIADELLDSGVIVSADGRTDDARFTDRATPGDASGGAVITVLVNSGSASAAEILAAALHDNSRAQLVGHRTYGKGSVQTIMPLSGGRALKLTTSRYFTPSGASLDHNGIVPDYQLSGSEIEPAELDAAGQQATLARRDPEVGIALQRVREQLRPLADPRTASVPRSFP